MKNNILEDLNYLRNKYKTGNNLKLVPFGKVSLDVMFDTKTVPIYWVNDKKETLLLNEDGKSHLYSGAFTMPIQGKPVIVIDSVWDSLDLPTKTYIIYHELGHIKDLYLLANGDYSLYHKLYQKNPMKYELRSDKYALNRMKLEFSYSEIRSALKGFDKYMEYVKPVSNVKKRVNSNRINSLIIGGQKFLGLLDFSNFLDTLD